MRKASLLLSFFLVFSWAVYVKENKARNYIEKTDKYLRGEEGTSKRKGYNATVWDIPRKHPTEDKWAVLICPEHIPPDNGDATVVETLTSDWFPEQGI